MQYLKEDIQEKILHIAEEVFSEKGYKDASMQRNCFPNRDYSQQHLSLFHQ